MCRGEQALNKTKMLVYLIVLNHKGQGCLCGVGGKSGKQRIIFILITASPECIFFLLHASFPSQIQSFVLFTKSTWWLFWINCSKILFPEDTLSFFTVSELKCWVLCQTPVFYSRSTRAVHCHHQSLMRVIVCKQVLVVIICTSPWLNILSSWSPSLLGNSQHLDCCRTMSADLLLSDAVVHLYQMASTSHLQRHHYIFEDWEHPERALVSSNLSPPFILSQRGSFLLTFLPKRFFLFPSHLFHFKKKNLLCSCCSQTLRVDFWSGCHRQETLHVTTLSPWSLKLIPFHFL